MTTSTILSDNGATSGTSGLKTSGGNDGTLILQTTTAGGTATTALTIDTSQNTTLAGSATAKSFIPNNSTVPTDGLYLPAASTVALSTGTTERMRIDSSGNVGIGTSSNSAGSKLDVNGIVRGIESFKVKNNSSNMSVIEFEQNANTSAYSYIKADGRNSGYIALCTNDTERARITSGGYFKASDNGTYNNSTGSYHELINTANEVVVNILNKNASFSSEVINGGADRSANSAYNFMLMYSAYSGTYDLEFRLRGDGNGYADGTWNNNGADYAEFFESANGQALTLGATVVLDGNKVREATDQDPASAIIGVVRPKEPSKASMVVGNTAWNKWANKYLTDDFDRYIMEDHDVVEWEEQVLEREAVAAVEAVVDEEGNEVSPAVPAQEATYKTVKHSYESHNIPVGITVPSDAIVKTHDDKGNKFQHYKLNPAWDKDAEYVNRENRPEWNIIGLLGQVKILKGQPVGDRWTKMRDVSATVEEWMIR